MDKRFVSVLVLVLALSGLVMVAPELASAQTITPTPTYPKPSIPEFALKLVSPVSETNETRIELTITNQPFDSSNAYHYSLVYNVRIRTPSDENWIELYNAEDGYPFQSDSGYTVLSYVLGESAYYPPEDYPLAPSMKVGVLPTEGQVDFQVEAMIGYRDRDAYVNGIMPYMFKGEKSGWSNTQTLTISDSSTPPEPEPFPAVPVAAVAFVAVVVAVGAGLLVYFKRRSGESIRVKGAALAPCLFIVLSVTLMPVVQSNLVLANAESSIPKPSVPEFTVKYVDNSYDVPPTYEVDPYTGKNITHAGYRVENKSIEITVRNQPFTPYRLDNEHYVNLFYNISYRGHYGEGWEYSAYDRNTEWFITQSDSEYTVISFYPVPTEGVMDFRVQAQIGYFTYYYMPFRVYEFHGETSGWSDIQTITIPTSDSSPASSPLSTSIPDQTLEPTATGTPQTLPAEAIIVAVIAVVLVIAGLLVYFKKRSRSQTA
ncbi:MAG: hypothetical protein NWE94_04325 [Candidatus Bathyarchaeota archaeon]|nr:hypothetical protein [Candidatus Bathyarchaeota archaeon]